jgi:protease-4
MPHVAQAIRNFKSEKPILTHFSGVCASAAYYIASQTNKIYASLGTDIVGSVGTMCSLRRINTENKNAEFIYESIYATKSTEKNFEFEQIKEGNPAPMRENILDPMNEQFHADVLLGRPNINKEIFTGKAMLASSAIKFNMIDGIKRLDEVIAEAYSLIK